MPLMHVCQHCLNLTKQFDRTGVLLNSAVASCKADFSRLFYICENIRLQTQKRPESETTGRRCEGKGYGVRRGVQVALLQTAPGPGLRFCLQQRQKNPVHAEWLTDERRTACGGRSVT